MRIKPVQDAARIWLHPFFARMQQRFNQYTDVPSHDSTIFFAKFSICRLTMAGHAIY